MATYESMDNYKPVVQTLEDFPDVPPPDYVTVGEINGQFDIQHIKDPDTFTEAYASVLNHFIKRNFPLSKEAITPAQAYKISMIKSANLSPYLVHQNEGVLKTIWTTIYYKFGSSAMSTIKELEKVGTHRYVVSFLFGTFKVWDTLRNCKRILKSTVYDHLKLSNKEMVNQFAPVRQWSTSWVRAMAWHPNLPKLAIALHDDSIKVFVKDSDNSQSFQPLLKAPEQELISCIAWHPFVSEFVVGVEKGFIIWRLTPPSTKIGFFNYPMSEFVSTVGRGHFPVTSIDYSSNGQRLVTSSAADGTILIWKLYNRTAEPFFRLAGGGVPRVSFSPNDTLEIFSNTPTNHFRFWEYENSRFINKHFRASSPVEAFAWHPSGKFLYFVSEFYLFRFSVNVLGEHQICPVFHLAETQVNQAQTRAIKRVGGKVIQIEFEPNGKRLAILFANTPYIAILNIIPERSSSLYPAGFICGEENEFPVAIAFQKDCQRGRSTLTIAWSSERIQYFPFLILGDVPQQNVMNEDCRMFSHEPKDDIGSAGDNSFSWKESSLYF